MAENVIVKSVGVALLRLGYRLYLKAVWCKRMKKEG